MGVYVVSLYTKQEKLRHNDMEKDEDKIKKEKEELEKQRQKEIEERLKKLKEEDPFIYD